MEFQFIDNNAPLDRESLRRVRQHAMKGKNAGRVLGGRGHKHSRLRQSTAAAAAADDRPPTQGERPRRPDGQRLLLPKAKQTLPESTGGSGPPASVFSGAEWTYFPTPVTVTPRMRRLFHECAFPGRYCCMARHRLTQRPAAVHQGVGEELYPRAFCKPSRQTASWFDLVMAHPCGE